MIKELTGYSQVLTDKLDSNSITLPVDNEYLLAALPEVGDFTYLTIDDGMNIEVVRAYNDAGEILIQRGYGDSNPTSFPAGSCVSFKINGAWIADFVCSLPKECKPNPLPSECGTGCCD